MSGSVGSRGNRDEAKRIEPCRKVSEAEEIAVTKYKTCPQG